MTQVTEHYFTDDHGRMLRVKVWENGGVELHQIDQERRESIPYPKAEAPTSRISIEHVGGYAVLVRAAKPKKIVATKRSGDCHACLDGHPEIWGAGRSQYEAIGDLVAHHPEHTGVIVETQGSSRAILVLKAGTKPQMVWARPTTTVAEVLKEAHLLEQASSRAYDVRNLNGDVLQDLDAFVLNESYIILTARRMAMGH